MTFINLSGDKISIYTETKNYLLEHGSLEKKLPELLNQLIEKDSSNTIYVLNGPGSFTNLRVGCLALNSLNFLTGNHLEFKFINKPDFFTYLVSNGFLPNIGVIYIGQRRNFRIYDFQTQTQKVVQKEEILELKSEYFVDFTYSLENEDLTNSGLNCDFEFHQKNQVYLKFKSEKKLLNLENMPWQTTKYLVPEYFIQPNIG